MANLTFERNTEPTPFIVAAQRDYACPEGSVWAANTPLGETCVAFLREDGTGLILVTDDPVAYTRGSDALAAGEVIGDWRGCPVEWTIERDGALDVSGDYFTISTSVEL